MIRLFTNTKIGLAILIVGLFLLTSCHTKNRNEIIIDAAEANMVERPDSALNMLLSIDKKDLRGEEEKARYALLLSMAMDKNWIDTTTFDILQPAIDYYAESDDQVNKLRTIYYTGVINLNGNNLANALATFNRGKKMGYSDSDTLTYGHLLVAQATIYHRLYKWQNAVENNIEAARLYHDLGKYKLEAKSLAKALNHSIMMNKHIQSDSIRKICEQRLAADSTLWDIFAPDLLWYTLTYGAEFEKHHMLEKFSDWQASPDNLKIDIAGGYGELQDYGRAFEILNSVDTTAVNKSKYLATKTDLYSKSGRYKEALITYMEYVHVLGLNLTDLFNQDFIFAEERQRLESEMLAAQESSRRAKLIYGWGLAATLLALLVISCLYYLERKRRRRLDDDLKRTTGERDRLNKEVETQKSECLKLEAELQEERSGVKPLSAAVRSRLGLLDRLLVEMLSERGKIRAKADGVDDVLGPRQEFLTSTRQVMTETNPGLIAEFMKAGLDDDEIDYLCLIVMGLSGKDAGEFMQNKRHYHMSSDIRRKLHLEEQGINLSAFIRKFTTME